MCTPAAVHGYYDAIQLDFFVWFSNSGFQDGAPTVAALVLDTLGRWRYGGCPHAMRNMPLPAATEAQSPLESSLHTCAAPHIRLPAPCNTRTKSPFAVIVIDMITYKQRGQIYSRGYINEMFSSRFLYLGSLTASVLEMNSEQATQGVLSRLSVVLVGVACRTGKSRY